MTNRDFVVVIVSSHLGCAVLRVWADRCLDELKQLDALLLPGTHITAGPEGYEWRRW